MRKLLTLLFLAVLAYSCNEEKPTEQIIEASESYHSKKSQIKESIRLVYNDGFSERDFQSTQLLDLENGFYQKIKSKLALEFPNENLDEISFQVEQSINAELLSSGRQLQLSSRLIEKSEKLMDLLLQSFSLYADNNMNAHSRIFSDDDISEDSLYAYMEEYKASVKNMILTEENSLVNDTQLSEEEKLALIAAYSQTSESIDMMVDGLVTDIINNESLENGRVAGKFGNWLRRTVNVIATVVARAVPAAITGALVGMAFGLPHGAVVGAIGGAALGAVEGLDCYSRNTCVTCVFCQPNPAKPCFEAGC